MTLLAEEEMDEDELTVYDVESVILTSSIVARQRERKNRERKYLVRGQTLDGETSAIVVGKFLILTVYVE